jgi:superfamily II DNA or RNA helicase/HKD family nuclease
VADQELEPGLYEALLTGELDKRLARLVAAAVAPELHQLADAEAADRLSRHLAAIVTRAIEALPEDGRARVGASIVEKLIELLSEESEAVDREIDVPLDPARVLSAILRRRPDGSPDTLEAPLTPLLDTTLLTNSRGEPAVGHELRAEVHSSDSIDVVMAFVRLSGINPMLDALRRHCREAKKLRLVTTTYTNSTELRALDELARLGAEIKVSYDTASTRLHAKAWLFHRRSGYSTAYIGSSNLTHSAMVTGLEWNVRVSGARNPDVVAKMTAVFESYWASGDFVPFDREEFLKRTEVSGPEPSGWLGPEIELRPFQDRLLEQIELARERGRHRNLLVAATGTGKTVMAAVDYATLRARLPRDRLLFVAHRAEILDQSRRWFQLALRDATFGEFWVGGKRPSRFEHVFASIQSLNRSGLESLDPSYFDVVIVDEFHHAAAPSYQALLERLKPTELLGMTATPERADGLDVLRYFDGRIAAELRVWDAIDQQYLAPFAYFGVHDGTDLTDVPWKRGTGYDPNALTNVLTADHAWARRVIEQLRLKTNDLTAIKALGFCVTIAHARFMAEQFRSVGISSVAIWGDSPMDERTAALRDLDAGRVNVVFTVDLFNEGVDVPNVDTLLLLRPTESGTLFLQQLGRGLRRARGKALCTVLDFVSNHRREFRYDRRFRALLGGSRKHVEDQIKNDFPFLPAGCHMELDPVARKIVLASIRNAIPSDLKARREELRSLGDVTLATYLEETGLELEDVYANERSWSELRRAVGLPTAIAGPEETPLLRAVGRLLHVDDRERLDTYRSLVDRDTAPDVAALNDSERRFARMLIASLTTLKTKAALTEGLAELWCHPQVRAELLELLHILPERVDHLHAPLGIVNVPLAVHARYTRTEILAAFDMGTGVKLPDWREGVKWNEDSRTDLFAFTLDKSAGSFSPTTRYRDYAISPELIHWESQSTTSADSDTGRRYISQTENGTNIVLFARLSTADRAFWCLGPATYVSHQGERPIAFTWQLEHRLPGDLYAEFAAAVA